MEDNFFEMPIDMNKSLAEIMDSTDKSRIFLTSDWHVMKYKYQKGRNYVNTNEIVKWCKENIKSNDIFIYLGDLCYRYANKEDSKKAQEIYKSLPGIKVLILGNHDIHQGEDFYNNCGFDYVFTEFEYHDIVFTHRPVNMIMRGNLSGLNIHGHIHELTNDYDFLDPSRNINVYPNNYGNKPTTLKYILNHINKLTKDNKPNNTTDLSDGLTESSRIIRDYLGDNISLIASVDESVLLESNDMEEYSSNHKKKTGGHFKYIDIDTTEGVKYLSTDPKCKKNLDYIKKNRRGEIVICTDDDKLAGYIFVCKDKKNDGYIQPLYIFKEYRGYGLSNKLLKDAIDKYNAIDLSVLADNKVAINLYKKYGFVIVGNDNTNKSKEGQLVYMKLKSKLTKDDKSFNESDGLTESSRIIRDYLGSQLDDSNIMNENYNVKKSRQFIMQVDKLAKKYGVNYFIVTDGASKIHNNGNPAVKHARDEHIKWELDNNSDPYEDWSDKAKEYD